MKTASQLAILVLVFFTLSTAVSQAEDYTYTTNNGTITITGYTGPGGAVDIPGTINGLPVTCIGEAAFSDCTNLTSVTIPNNVASIGYWMFNGCTSLTSVTIGNSLTTIGYGAFDSCTSLSVITVVANNPVYSSVDGVLFNKSQTALLLYPAGKAGSQYTIPNSVTNIGGESFVWPGAFYSCTSLTNIIIPNSVTSIGDGAFLGCTSLTSITIPDSVTSIGNSAFRDCTSLTSVTIGNSVTWIGGGAFQNCTSLTSITIPDSVTSIGGRSMFWGGAFQNCTSLTSITIPDSISSIGKQAFYSCISLMGVNFMGNAPGVDSDEYGMFGGADNVTVYYLPGATGWGTTFGDRPTAFWVLPTPTVLTSSPSFGIQTNGFGFIISWATNVPVVIEACTSLTNPVWSPVRTNTLTDGSSYFSDPEWMNHPSRFYRIRSQ